MLILDEVTNNIDLQMRQHIIDVLNGYTGTLLVISHDYDFLQAININRYFEINNRLIQEKQ